MGENLARLIDARQFIVRTEALWSMTLGAFDEVEGLTMEQLVASQEGNKREMARLQGDIIRSRSIFQDRLDLLRQFTGVETMPLMADVVGTFVAHIKAVDSLQSTSLIKRHEAEALESDPALQAEAAPLRAHHLQLEKAITGSVDQLHLQITSLTANLCEVPLDWLNKSIGE